MYLKLIAYATWMMTHYGTFPTQKPRKHRIDEFCRQENLDAIGTGSQEDEGALEQGTRADGQRV